MLHYAVMFFVLALIASALGLGGVAGLSAQLGWFFGTVAVAMLIIALVNSRGRLNWR